MSGCQSENEGLRWYRPFCGKMDLPISYRYGGFVDALYKISTTTTSYLQNIY